MTIQSDIVWAEDWLGKCPKYFRVEKIAFDPEGNIKELIEFLSHIPYTAEIVREYGYEDSYDEYFVIYWKEMNEKEMEQENKRLAKEKERKLAAKKQKEIDSRKQKEHDIANLKKEYQRLLGKKLDA